MKAEDEELSDRCQKLKREVRKRSSVPSRHPGAAVLRGRGTRPGCRPSELGEARSIRTSVRSAAPDQRLVFVSVVLNPARS